MLLLHLRIASGAVSCSLMFKGYGNKQGIKLAHLSCTGGSITAAAHPILLGNFSSRFSGVTWSKSGGCGIGVKICLLTICNSTNATFSGAVITNVNGSRVIGALLCVMDSSSLVFDNTRLHGNTGLPLLGEGTAVHIHIKNSRLTNNTNLVEDLVGAALLINGGTGLVQSSIFAGNRGLLRGGAIGISHARLRVESSVLQANAGERKRLLQIIVGQ
jgi:hypothetical protein